MINYGLRFLVNLHENVSPSAKLSVIFYEKSKFSQKSGRSEKKKKRCEKKNLIVHKVE